MQHDYCKFNLREKFIPELEGAKHFNGGKGGNEVFLECGDGVLGGICSMVVQGGKLYVDCFGPDVLLDYNGTLVVHYVQCRMVAARFQYGDDFDECLFHGSIGAKWHGLDDDCIKVIDEGNKHILHTLKEWTGEVLVMFVYMVPVMASASTAKQNISCTAQIS
jgi:hypothetical protein